MNLNWIGLVAAACTFLGVWLGHVSVRWIERRVQSLWMPALGAACLGLGLEAASLWTFSLSPLMAAGCGILGMTLLWDALEFHRQERRVRRGHAPANPHNPRHARILAEHPAAGTLDWLDRDPRGQPYSDGELRALKEFAR
ncbi:MAG: DUF4491 family protein [Chloroflexota bacterium]